MENKLAVFYHVFQHGNWREIYTSQLEKLQNSGLYDAADHIHIGVNGHNLLPKYLPKITSIQYNKHRHLESDTLLELFKFCHLYPDYKVLYLHTKGVTWHDDLEVKVNVDAWREYLEYFNIEHWRKSVNLLQSYDCVGTEWHPEASLNGTELSYPHYAGNFWWANASYIQKLDPDFLYQPTGRWLGEFWIGTKNPNYFNYYFNLKNKYYHIIKKEEYQHLINYF